jgi:hypothetical protein
MSFATAQRIRAQKILVLGNTGWASTSDAENVGDVAASEQYCWFCEGREYIEAAKIKSNAIVQSLRGLVSSEHLILTYEVCPTSHIQ